MESPSSLVPSPTVFLLTTLVIIGIFKVFTVVYQQHYYWKKKDVPHMNSVPFLGTAWKVMFGRINFAIHTHYMYNYYQDVKYIGIMDFDKPTILLRDPQLIRDVTVKDFEHFSDHRSVIDEDTDPLFARNVFSLRGDRWKEMRNTLSPSFTASKMKIMFGLVSKCSNDLIDYLVDHPELCSAMDTKDVFRRYTTDVIATAAFGINVNSMEDRDNEFYTRGVELTNSWWNFLKFMLIRIIPRFTKLIGLTIFPSSMSKFFKRIVGETIRVREEQGIIRPDMIHLLMQARDKEDSNVYEMTLDDIVAQAFIFFLAGFETSSMLMCYVAHELAVNRNIQERLREEVEQHLTEGNGGITYESLTKMVYMDMVISETLRKYPPVIHLDRLCTKNYELPPSQPGHKGTVIDTSIALWIPVYGLHHDPKYFPNPSKFDPERFSDENKDNIIPYTYLPFGHGPRMCIGNRFALMETKLLVANLLRKFILKPTEKTVEPVVLDKKQFALHPVGGFWIGLEKREM